MAPGLQGMYAKLKGYCARLALIHAVCTDPMAPAVEQSSVAAAADLVDYFKAQARKVIPLLSQRRATVHQRCEQDIKRALSGRKVLTKRELQRTGNTPAGVFNEVFEAMVKADQLEETEKVGGKGPRKAYKLAEEPELSLF